MKHEVEIPEGCNVKFSVENGKAIVEIEGRATINKGGNTIGIPTFKENDIVISHFNNNASISVFGCYDVENKFESKCSFNIKSECFATENVVVVYDKMRLASDSEKQFLFDKLKEKCLMFNGTNIVRWRAKDMGDYYTICGSGEVLALQEYGDEEEEMFYSIGNYFPTKEVAEAYKKVLVGSLNQFHKSL